MKVSINQQIEEVERELAIRKDFYNVRVQQRKMTRSKADFHAGRMQAALATLVWVRDNKEMIKSIMRDDA